MSGAFRGARVLSSLGQHAMRCNRLHQRRIVSLGLTSLCQVTTKHRALLDTTTQPVNKYDLSTTSLVSAVTEMMSRDIAEVGDDEDELLEGPETELSLLVKWFSCNETMYKLLRFQAVE